VTGDQVRRTIRENLGHAGVVPDEIRVQPDPFGGWRIVVLAAGFEGLPDPERRRMAFAGIDANDIEWGELFTPSEVQWAGPLPTDSELTDLPLWASALARARLPELREAAPLFPSNVDQDLPTPIITTFYSVRGGVGRSTALAYTGEILASKGRKVVAVDLDLEAPGLAAIYGVEDQIAQGQGVLPLLRAIDKGDNPDFSRHLIRVSEGSELYCVPAGLTDATYARMLAQVDLQAWYSEDRNPLRLLIQGLSERLPFKPDVILLDSGTGISSISAPLLFDLADIAVIVFFPHPQTRSATKEVVRALMSAHTRRVFDGRRLTPEPRFLVSPIPASRLAEVVKKYRTRSGEWIADWLSTTRLNSEGGDATTSEITHFVPYREDLATSDRVIPDAQVWRDFETVADWVERFLPAAEEVRAPAIGDRKSAILEELEFSAGTAEQQPDFLLTFVETDIAKKALDPLMPLVLGRKGTGKTAIFRRLLEKQETLSIPVMAPAPLRGGRSWLFGADHFEAADELLQRSNKNWRHFWGALAGLSCYYGGPAARERPTPESAPPGFLPDELRNQMSAVETIEKLFALPKSNLLLSDWLDRFDSQFSTDVLLLFDGLDTGFGNSDRERERRRSAIEGLFAFLTDQSERRRLRYKVVLREDIWGKLRFENKSHFFGRSVKLEWREQATYFKVALKQAVQSRQFESVLHALINGSALGSVDTWGAREVWTAWNTLVGERMRGAGTTFTRNWVWNRLSDANDDHSPRYLLQLFREVTSLEKTEQRKSAYDRSVLRPRALINSLPQVSRLALDALQEEFPELQPLLVKLRSIGRTPIPAEELSEVSDVVPLAREVGLLGIYEGTEEEVDRYKVPEVFRYALDMTRKGQA